ncbi:hypothetical protein JT358_11815 [Micrococcales bacterium 31B]|nr:hypothetical protein [Micrococcales bacterium 31B]
MYDENPANFVPFTELPFERQSATGMSDSQLLDVAREAWATDAISSCISTHKFGAWVARGENAWKPLTNGTPAVFFNGTALSSDITNKGMRDPAPLEGAMAAALASAP